MFTHAEIWRGIDRLAAHAQTSPSGLARRAGLDSTTFNPSKRFSADGTKARWPSTESLSKALRAANLDISGFAALVRGETELKGLPAFDLADRGKAAPYELAPQSRQSWEREPFPGVALDDAFILRLTGLDAAPVFRHGDRIVVSQTEKPRPGDRVVVEMRDGETSVWELDRATVQQVYLKSLNPDRPDRTIKLSDLRAMSKILWASQEGRSSG